MESPTVQESTSSTTGGLNLADELASSGLNLADELASSDRNNQIQSRRNVKIYMCIGEFPSIFITNPSLYI